VTDLTSIGDAAEIINRGTTPVGKLKVAVCRQMKELAKISCPKTIELVNKWFGAYQSNLIMNDLNEFPEIQVKYLRDFIEKNEVQLKNVVMEAEYVYERKPLADKYEKYLVRYIDLLSDENKEESARVVDQEWYPIQPCLDVVRAKKNRLAEAVLVRRDAEYLKAI